MYDFLARKGLLCQGSMEGRSQTRWSLKGLDKICSQIQTKTCLIRCDPHFETNLLLHRYYTFFDKIPFEHRNLGKCAL